MNTSSEHMRRFRAIMEVEDFLTPREEAELDLQRELQRYRARCRCQHPECEDCYPNNKEDEHDDGDGQPPEGAQLPGNR